jgi:hypothetical protein
MQSLAEPARAIPQSAFSQRINTHDTAKVINQTDDDLLAIKYIINTPCAAVNITNFDE